MKVKENKISDILETVWIVVFIIFIAVQLEKMILK